MVTSSFDACEYISKEERFKMRSIFIFTTNSRVRGERMTDRECIIEYERGNPSEEKRESSRLAVSFVLNHIGHGIECQYWFAASICNIIVKLFLWSTRHTIDI